MEIVPGVHSIPGIRWSRAYLIEDDTLALVDAGLPWDAGRIVDYIRSIGRRPDELGMVLMTHSHPDHAGGALPINKRTGAEVVAHAGDTKTHADQVVSLSYLGIFSTLKVPLPFLQRTPARTIGDGHILPLLGGIRAIHTPGHTPGSLCFLLESRGVLFSGDTVFSDGTRVSRSVPFPGANILQYRDSIERLAGLEFDVLCGGHGSPLVGGASEALRELLRRSPDPPTWSGLLKSLPGRLYRSRGPREEDP